MAHLGSMGTCEQRLLFAPAFPPSATQLVHEGPSSSRRKICFPQGPSLVVVNIALLQKGAVSDSYCGSMGAVSMAIADRCVYLYSTSIICHT